MRVQLNEEERSRVIEMAWEDRTPFEAIARLFGLREPDVIDLMRLHLKPHLSGCGANASRGV